MQLIDEVKNLFRFEIGQQVYIKQDIINDFSRMSINGTDIDKILLQKALIIHGMIIEIEDAESYMIRYLVRPDMFRQIAEKVSGNVFLSLKDFELCSREEAIVILRLKDSAE